MNMENTKDTEQAVSETYPMHVFLFRSLYDNNERRRKCEQDYSLPRFPRRDRRIHPAKESRPLRFWGGFSHGDRPGSGKGTGRK